MSDLPTPSRRELLRQLGLFTATTLGLGGGLTWLTRRPGAEAASAQGLSATRPASPYDAHELATPWAQATSYNNFYELGTDKADPARNAAALVTRPWTVQLDGELRQPRTIDIDTLQSWFPLEDRLYRLRCVEGWSMVMPWLGFPLAALIRRLEPTSKAKYVKFTAVHDPKRLPGQRSPILDWPYVEGLRLDEALHPLSFLAVGLHGRILPGQNGAPLRLVVPWKYGFKSIKSIVRITLTAEQPKTTWSLAAPQEYGFYANVNPQVPHPRWSQASERRIGGLLPSVVLLWDASTGTLGANPLQRATSQTGLLALWLLVLSLSCTPLRKLCGWTWPARIRKSLGLLAFGYALLHLGLYLFDHGFSLGLMLEDILKRPFITMGFTALLLLVPLALTSSVRMVARLGFERWTRLHQLVYLAVSLGALHYFWAVKRDKTAPLILTAVLAVLLLSRWLFKHKPQRLRRARRMP